MANMFKWTIWLSIAAVVIAVSGIVGHLFGIRLLLTWGHSGELMSVPSSAAIFLLSLCVLLLSAILSQMSGIILRLHNIYTDKEFPDEIKKTIKGNVDK